MTFKPWLPWYACTIGLLLLSMNVGAQSPGFRRITLEEAQAQAASGNAANLPQLGIDAARYHRKAAQADYWPKIESDFLNLHFNKFMGQTIQLARRQADLPLLTKDQTIVAVSVTQPITPLFKVRKAVAIASADEEIAGAKAAQAAAQIASNVERSYFELLIAERRRDAARAKLETIDGGLQVVSVNTSAVSAVQQARLDLIKASEEALKADNEVVQLRRSLNSLIGFPPDTELQLVLPAPVIQTVSVPQATQQALASNPEVVEAEQTVVKAKAAASLAKLEYVPDVAAVGGYIYERAIPLLPRDFSFIGVVASWTLFDFGKRENIIRERHSQVAMAEANVDLVKTKVANEVQKAFFELRGAQKVRDLTRQLAATYYTASVSASPEARAARADAEAEMLKAELDCRTAYASFRRFLGE
jgi:outer membrane protein